MIDINNLRLLVQDCKLAGSPVFVRVNDMNEILDRIEAAEKDIVLKEGVIDSLGVTLTAVVNERDELQAKVEAMEKQEPFDADSDVFRSSFEAALKAGNWPATRQGDGYRAAYSHIAWRISFSTVNRLKLYALPGAKGE